MAPLLLGLRSSRVPYLNLELSICSSSFFCCCCFPTAAGSPLINLFLVTVSFSDSNISLLISSISLSSWSMGWLLPCKFSRLHSFFTTLQLNLLDVLVLHYHPFLQGLQFFTQINKIHVFFFLFCIARSSVAVISCSVSWLKILIPSSECSSYYSWEDSDVFSFFSFMTVTHWFSLCCFICNTCVWPQLGYVAGIYRFPNDHDASLILLISMFLVDYELTSEFLKLSDSLTSSVPTWKLEISLLPSWKSMRSLTDLFSFPTWKFGSSSLPS
jgi:hypothetical protein